MRAYGFTVSAPEIDLPGAPDAAAGADVEVLLAPADEVEGAFSGPADPPRVGLRRVSGRAVRYERGAAGDLSIAWEGAAAFHLSAQADRVLGWAPAGPDPAWTRFLLDSVLASVALRRGAEALHAGTVDLPGGVGAVAVAAGQGGGKSTLLGALVASGATLVADDISVLRHDAGGFAVEPAPPVMNIALDRPPGAADPEDLGEVLAEIDDEAWVLAHRAAQAPVALRAVVQLERRAGAACAVRLVPPSPIALLANALDSGADSERQRARFDLLSDLAQSVPFLLLEAPLEAAPGPMADMLVRAIADR